MNIADRAQLALLYEVAGTPKPGNVDRARDHPNLRFEQFLAGAVGAGRALRAVPEPPLGKTFERAVAGMADAAGTNTQFGALLLLVPLCYASQREEGPATRVDARAVVDSTTVEDACSFYRAFEHASVAVDDPPEGMDDLDVRRGADAVPAVRDRGLTLAGLMEKSAGQDGVAREWTRGFERTFHAAGWILDAEGSAGDRAAGAFLRLLAGAEDTFITTTSGEAAASEATRRARAAVDGREDPSALAAEFVERGINPGTTADITAAALFVALERGLQP